MSQENNKLEPEEIAILRSAELENDSKTQFSVGLNIFEELSNKYNRQLKS
jgi:hypothetical protein